MHRRLRTPPGRAFARHLARSGSGTLAPIHIGSKSFPFRFPRGSRMKRSTDGPNREGTEMAKDRAAAAVIAKGPATERRNEDTASLLRELVSHLRANRTELREHWARRITEAKLLTAMTKEEIFAEATSVYDNYVEVLETGSV